MLVAAYEVDWNCRWDGGVSNIDMSSSSRERNETCGRAGGNPKGWVPLQFINADSLGLGFVDEETSE